MKSVVICGSRRFSPEIRQFAKDLKALGVTVFEPILNQNKDINALPNDLKRFAFLGLTWHHLEFIRKADVVFVFNKDGYMGVSCTLELGAASALGKPVYALTADITEQCRQVLFDEIVTTPKALVKKLI